MTRGYMTWGCLGLVAGVALSAFVAQGSNSGVASVDEIATQRQRNLIWQLGRPPEQWTQFVVLVSR
jgi:hypothetical protein